MPSIRIANPYAWHLLIADMKPDQERVRSAVRLTVGLAVIALVGYATKTEIERAGLSLVVLSFMNPIGSFRISLNRMVGNIFGCVFGALVAAAFIQMPAAFGIAVFTVNAIMMFLTYRGYATFISFIGPLTFNLVTFYAITHPRGYGGYAWTQFIEFSFGILVTMMVQRLLWPVDIRQKLRTSLADKLDRNEQNLTAVRECFRGNPPHIEANPPKDQHMVAQLQLLNYAVFEVNHIYRFQPEWNGLLMLTEGVRVAHFEAATIAADLHGAIRAHVPSLVGPIIDHCDALAAVLGDLSRCVRSATIPDARLQARAQETTGHLDAAIDRLRKERMLDPIPTPDASRINALIEALRSSHLQSRDIARDLAAVNSPVDATRKDAAPYMIIRPINRMHVLTNDPDDAVRALKVGLCAFALMALTSAYHGLSTTTVETCVLLSTVSTGLGGFLQKGVNRFMGALIGMLLAFVTTSGLLPTMDNIAPLMLVLVVMVFPMAFVVSCGDRVNYIGVQMLVTWFIVTYIGYKPQLSVGYDTSYASGVFVGFGVYGAIFLAFEPPSSAKRIRRLAGVFAAGVSRFVHSSVDRLKPLLHHGMISFNEQYSMYDAMKHLAEYISTSDYERLFGVERATQEQLNKVLEGTHLLYRKVASFRLIRSRLTEESLRSESDLAVTRASLIAAEWLHHIAAQWADRTIAPDNHREDMRQALEAAAAHFTDDRATQRFAAWSAPNISAHFAQLSVLGDLRELLLEFEVLTHGVNIVGQHGEAMTSSNARAARIAS